MSHPPAQAGRPAAAPAQYLTFALGAELYGMDIAVVREILQHEPLTAVPLMPDFVRGVISLRGTAVPVIDLQVRFGRPPAVVGKRTCFVIFDSQREGERIELGLLVDAVNSVVEIPADRIEPPPQLGTAAQRELVQGMGRLGERFVILLRPDQALECSQAQALHAAAQEAVPV